MLSIRDASSLLHALVFLTISCFFQTLKQGVSYHLPQSCDLPFTALNVAKQSDNQNKNDGLSGMAVHFELAGTHKDGNDVNGLITLGEHVLKRCNSLVLSEDHLREWIYLKEPANQNQDEVTQCERVLPTTNQNQGEVTKRDHVTRRKGFVLTSVPEDGIIHIFIKDDACSVVNIKNNLSSCVVLKEVLSSKMSEKHYDILENNHDNLITLPTLNVVGLQPVSFKTLFPKTNNPLEIYCQFGVWCNDTIELSKPVKLAKDGTTTVYLPGFGDIHFSAVVRNAQLFVEINDKILEHQMLSKPLALPVCRIAMSSLDVMLIDRKSSSQIQGLLSLSMSSFSLLHQVNKECSSFRISMGGVQVDNQLQDACYHFPVVFLPMRELSERYHTVTSDAPFPELEASLDRDFCSCIVTVSCYDDGGNGNDNVMNVVCVDEIQVKLQPCEMYLEDTFLYRISKLVGSYIPVWTQKKDLDSKIKNVELAVSPILNPIRVCIIDIEETSVLLSIHASVKMFLAADHIPLRLGHFHCRPTLTVSEELMRMLLYHYATQVLVRVGWIIGSFDIIGNPTGLIHSIGRGLSDFFVLPYQGLTRGPTAFVSGISHGMTSFLRHVSMGTLTSITNVSSSISRNMDRLCFDETHMLIQEERRTHVPTRTITGIKLLLQLTSFCS